MSMYIYIHCVCLCIYIYISLSKEPVKDRMFPFKPLLINILQATSDNKQNGYNPILHDILSYSIINSKSGWWF